jgi:hypothetical protein
MEFSPKELCIISNLARAYVTGADAHVLVEDQEVFKLLRRLDASQSIQDYLEGQHTAADTSSTMVDYQ